MTTWRPLSERDAEPSGEPTLYDDVPKHLRRPLADWLDAVLLNSDGNPEARQHRLSLVAARARFAFTWNGHAATELLAVLQQPSMGTKLLDVIDATLAGGISEERQAQLEQLLLGGSSAWQMAPGGGSLQRRVNVAAVDAYAQAAVNNAGPHLKAAWAAAYGRQPNPSRAYSEAIKAVEAAAIPVVVPGAQGAKATLGKVIIALDTHQRDWQLAISPRGVPSDVAPLLGMLRLLWQGQTDRHGSQAPTVPVTAPAAEAAVHLAVSLVQWFYAGAVQRVSGG